MIPQRLPGPATTYERVCAFATKWTLDLVLAVRLQQLQSSFPFALRIFSGFRSLEKQQELLDRPDSSAAELDRSTHTSCPATGADVSVDWTEVAVPVVGGVGLPIPPGMGMGMNDFPTDSMKLYFGRHAEAVGLRWGGGARRENGVPIGNEWRHLDLGPRK